MIQSVLIYRYLNAHYETFMWNLGNELFYHHENSTNSGKDIFDEFLYNI